MNFLEKVVKQKKKSIKQRQKILPLSELKNKVKKSNRSFEKALSKKGLSFITEIKRASPSQGVIRRKFDVAELASCFDEFASAISVLTEEEFFQGKPEHLSIAKQNSSKPILAKDFFVDSYQLFEARYFGADAVLLIASILSRQKLSEFISLAKQLGLDALVEVHSKRDFLKAVDCRAEIIGVNNRDLDSLKTDVDYTRKLLGSIPENLLQDKLIVSESGFTERRDIKQVEGLVDAVLVGTALMKAKNSRAKLKELSGVPLIKFCGITSKTQALNAVRAGADFLGFNFFEGSPRFIPPEKAREIIQLLPPAVSAVGVFVDEDRKKVEQLMNFCGLNFLQFHGNESPEYCDYFEREKVIKVFRIKDNFDLSKLSDYSCEFFLFDTFVNGLRGGTGKTFNHDLVNGVRKKFFLSGGLNAKNVVKAISNVNPFGVDICSAIERSPGRKDFRKMKSLVDLVNSGVRK